MDTGALLADAAPDAGAVGLLITALVLGLRHGIDWDHIAAITDITSTTAATEAAEEAHRAEHVAGARGHPHGGTDELHVHEVEAEGPVTAALPPALPVTRTRFLAEQRRAIELGSLYALGHASVVAALGLAALAFGALLPAWVDPIMGRVVGVTLIVLGVWVLYSVYAYLRHGTEFRLRSRWMLVFDSFRYAWRWLGARIHGHEHVEPLEASAYRPRTAFAVRITATGFAASQLRQRLYVVIGTVAGVFSLVVGGLFLFEAEGILPALTTLIH